MKKWNADARTKRLFFYLSLLAAAVFFAARDPDQVWLAAGIGAGLLYAIASDWIFGRGRKTKDPEKLSTKNEETVENGAARRTNSEEKDAEEPDGRP
jgi:hypothetical protein